MRSRWISRVVFWGIVVILAAMLASSMHVSRRQSSAAATPLDATQRDPQALHAQITVWSWNVAAKSLRSLLPEFHKIYPNIDVDVSMSGTNLQTRFLLSLASGSGAPDIMQLQGFESARYIETGRMTDLTAVAQKYEHDFTPASWANCVYRGHVYAIPWDVGPCAVFYKPDVLARYGVDPKRIETWDDFIEAGKQVVERSHGQTRMMPLGGLDFQQVYEILLQQLDGQVFDAQGRIAIDSQASRKVLDLMRRLLDSGICATVPQFSHEWMASLNSDSIATYPGAVWLGGTIKDTAADTGGKHAQWRVFPLPAFERGGSHSSNFGGSVLTIPTQCPNKEAAWAFIEYALCTRQGQLAQYANYDLFPAYLPALDDPFFNEPDPFYGGQKVRLIFVAAAKGVPVLNRTADWVEASTYVNQLLTAWAANHESTPKMLSTLAKKLQRRLGREIAPDQEARR